MARGPLYEELYRPQFSGHETFPLRYGWLKKAFDAVYASREQTENKSVFLRDDAIARFGVGKNMVSSMRHWASAAGITSEETKSGIIRTTELGQKIFGPKGLDPYMEDPATLWLIHWHLSGRSIKTTWFWVFNHFPAATFEREQLVRGLEKLASDRSWSRVALATIRRDVECFVRTYVARLSAARGGLEDALESPLIELGLIRAIGRRDGFRFVRGPKSSLGDGVFLYALIDFWQRYSKARTLSFEAIAHEIGSPGRVFLLDESDIVSRLVDLEEMTDGQFRWSETAGLKQVLRKTELSLPAALHYVEGDYQVDTQRECA
jgi:hypothetical protein